MRTILPQQPGFRVATFPNLCHSRAHLYDALDHALRGSS
jgi:hypothetical protein